MDDYPEEVGTNTDQYALERGRVFFCFFWKPESDGTRYTHAIDIMQSYVIDDFTFSLCPFSFPFFFFFSTLCFPLIEISSQFVVLIKTYVLFTTQTKNKTRRTRKDS